MVLSRKTPSNSKIDIGILIAAGAGLAALVWVVFGQTVGHQFINYDDPLYVLSNPHINRGLSWASAKWAFTHVHSQNWHPITSISHMLDCQILGVRAGAHHAVNVFWHMVTAVLLLAFLRRTTEAIWTSAFVAAVWAIHPLRVESVAWIAERKDVLSGAFFMATLLSYAWYVLRPSLGRYLLVLLALAGGLMSKPMLVTAPVVLLLLDYWPLGRVEGSGFRVQVRQWQKLAIEKIPLFGLVAGSVVATLWAQNFALGSTETLPVKWRLTNALVTYVDYIRQTFWPHDLIPFYVHPEGRLQTWQVVGAVVVLLAISCGAIARRKQNPYLLVGWCWYLVMLVPVIGVVQVGLQARADRYTYLPQIGLLIAVGWLVRDLTNAWRDRVRVLAPAGAVCVILLAVLSFRQTTHWRDTETLWSYTLMVTPNSDVAHTGLAGILFVRGQVDEAIEHYRRALQVRPGNSGAQYGLAVALEKQRKVDEAIEHYRQAIDLQPDNVDARKALALLDVHRGDFADAIGQWETALSYEPDDGDAANNLAWVLTTSDDGSLRNPARAIELAQHANQLARGSNPAVLRTLAVSYAENHQFTEAIAAAERAVQIADASGRAALADDIRRYLNVFRSGKSWRESRQQ